MTDRRIMPERRKIPWKTLHLMQNTIESLREENGLIQKRLAALESQKMAPKRFIEQAALINNLMYWAQNWEQILKSHACVRPADVDLADCRICEQCRIAQATRPRK